MATYHLVIPGWIPTRINEWDGKHWGARARKKKKDRTTIEFSARISGIPAATCKRRVHLILIFSKGERFGDPDAYWKSTNDALVHARMLKNDSNEWVELGRVVFVRGQRRCTKILLTDLIEGNEADDINWEEEGQAKKVIQKVKIPKKKCKDHSPLPWDVFSTGDELSRKVEIVDGDQRVIITVRHGRNCSANTRLVVGSGLLLKSAREALALLDRRGLGTTDEARHLAEAILKCEEGI